MKRKAGFSLIEVMVAVFVLAVGLLGVGILVTLSVKNSFTATQHLQATFVARSIIDRMAANTRAVWIDAYDGRHSAFLGSSVRCHATPCTALQLAQYDIEQWKSELALFLGVSASGQIQCAPSAPLPTHLETSPVYAGECQLHLAWQQVQDDGRVLPVDLSWKFRP